MKKTTSGFTIVELLIVIVVIAILAAISVVAYTGIQNRANDTAIQSDLNNLAKKIQIAAADTGEFPAGGATRSGGADTGSSNTIPGFTFPPSKSAYNTTAVNLYYCTGIETSSGQKVFFVQARSKSGNTFYYRSNDSLQNLGNVSASQAGTCGDLADPYTWARGYRPDTQAWTSWTN